MKWWLATETRRCREPHDRARRALPIGCMFAAFAMLATAPLDAQVRSVVEGLRLNVHGGAALLDGDAGEGQGVRPGVSAAYGNSRLFTVFATYDRVPMNDGTLDFDMRHLDLGVRVWLRREDAALVPFALASYTWRSADYGTILFLGEMMDVEVHGGGLTAGVGAAYHITPHVALEASFKRSGGAMDRVNANGLAIRHEESHIAEASYRLNIGVSWWSGRGGGPRSGPPHAITDSRRRVASGTHRPIPAPPD